MNEVNLASDGLKDSPAKMTQNVSIIIATYRRPETLKNTLKSLGEQEWNHGQIEVLVLDNDPERSAEKIVYGWSHPKKWIVKYISQTTKGKIYSMKAGVEKCNYDIILNLDDDVILEPNLLLSYADAVLKWPNALSFGGPVICICPDGIPKGFNVEGPCRLYLAWPQHDCGSSEMLYPKEKNPMGSNRIIRKRTFELGLTWTTMFTDLGLYTCTEDDMGFSKRIHDMNGEMVYVPQAKVYHVVSPEAFSFKKLYKRYFGYGRYQFLSTDKGTNRFRRYRYLFRDITVDYMKSLWFLVTNNIPASRYHFFEAAREMGMIKEWISARKKADIC